MKYIPCIIVLGAFVLASCGTTDVGNVDITIATDAVGDGSDATDPGDTPGDGTPEDTAKDAGPEDSGSDAGCDPGAAGACTEAGAARCAEGDAAAVERCEEVAGCLVWATAEECSNLNKCTGEADVCSDGACVPPDDAPDPNLACDVPDNPCVEALCNPDTGSCKDYPIADDVPCDDGDVCSENDFCFDGECKAGESICPMEGVLDDLACGESVTVSLADGESNMDIYGCDEGANEFTGYEVVYKIQSTGDFACPGAVITVEFDDPNDVGANTVGMIQLDDSDHAISQTSIWPSECVASTVMTDEGLVEMTFDIAADSQYFVVIDGVDGYAGDVRISNSCCGLYAEVCSNGIDDNNIEGADCMDPLCADSGMCDYEYDCDDGVDNDDNGLTDCFDPACNGTEECNIEYMCDDGKDDDGDELVDCDDPDCASDGACAAQCDDATVLTCGDVLTDQVLTEADVTQLAGTTCNDKAEYNEAHLQKFYRIEPNCDGDYTVTVQAIDDNDDTNGFFDVHLMKNACSVDAVCGGTAALGVFGDELSQDLSTDAFPTAWLGVMSLYDLPAAATGPFAVSVTCDCDE